MLQKIITEPFLVKYLNFKNKGTIIWAPTLKRSTILKGVK